MGSPSPARRMIDVVDPATGERVGRVAAATSAEIDTAIGAARTAFAAWRATPPGERAAALKRAAAQVAADVETLADIHVRDTGRLRADAIGAVQAAAGLLAEAAEHGPLDAGRSLAGALGALDVVRREPRGVVAVITPWNDPYPVAAGLLGAALVTGNTVVHKPSERSPLAGRALAERIARHLPEGVLTVVDGDAEVGAAVVANPNVDVITHVGSSRAGREIAAVGGARGARLVLENGGKDVLIVDRDVDPAWAAEQAALGAFTNAGQLCVSVERILVHERIAEPFLDALVAQARRWTPGAPGNADTRLGPLIDERALAAVEGQVRAAVDAGATLHVGGRRAELPGCFYEATVLSGCRDGMALWDEETFGPIAPVRVVASFDEALDVADRTTYGLAATVLSASLERALQAAERLDVGTVKVNNVFGGAPGGSADPRRGSGSGRGYGPDLIGELTTLKTIHVEAAPPGA